MRRTECDGPERTMIASQDAQIGKPNSESSQAGDGSCHGERVSAISQHQGHRPSSEPKSVEKDARSPSHPTYIQREEQASAEVFGLRGLLCDDVEQYTVVCPIPRYVRAR
jgi:hypothetical protein